MKFLKSAFGLIAIVAIAASCTTSKHTGSPGKGIDGSWSLQTINMEGIDSKFDAKVFDEADMSCFIGSNWQFSSKDNTGSFALTGGAKGCSTLQRNIHWTLKEPGNAQREFQFRRVDGSNNSLDDSSGFRLNVSLLNANAMQLKSAITFEGKPGNIVYNFVKK